MTEINEPGGEKPREWTIQWEKHWQRWIFISWKPGIYPEEMITLPFVHVIEAAPILKENAELKSEVEYSKAESRDMHNALMNRNAELDKLKAQNKILMEAMERIVGMVEVWTDEHGQKNIEEIYASRIAREALDAVRKVDL